MRREKEIYFKPSAFSDALSVLPWETVLEAKEEGAFVRFHTGPLLEMLVRKLWEERQIIVRFFIEELEE